MAESDREGSAGDEADGSDGGSPERSDDGGDDGGAEGSDEESAEVDPRTGGVKSAPGENDGEGHLPGGGVMDHLVRRRLYTSIAGNPGMHYNALKVELDLKDGVLSHHLHVLEKEGALVSRNERNRRCFYPTAKGYPARGLDRLTDMQAGILYHVQSEQGITQGELAGRLGVSKQDLNYHLRELCAEKLVYRRRVSRNTHLYVDPNRLARDLL